MPRYIFITGGVVSSLGKGVSAAALGALLQAHGYRVLMRKLDPYLNADAGTMNPFEHGEVFVTDDGAETDLDLGHYERFTNTNATRKDNVTSGGIYRAVFEREREGDYGGRTVQVIPHVTDEIIRFILSDVEGYDFVVCEIGGTVGDIEGLPFFESIRQLSNRIPTDERLFIHLTLVPYVGSSSEMKTKPTQHSVKELRAIGITPDVLLARCDHDITEPVRQKISLFCNVPQAAVVGMPTVDTTYSLPLLLRDRGLDKTVLSHFGMWREAGAPPDLQVWEAICQAIRSPTGGKVSIAVVGKYTDHGDAYFSLDEALTHAGIANQVEVEREYISSELFDQGVIASRLKQYHAILVPGGFGSRGRDGMINVIRYARERKIPYLGICYGMQLAVIEAARNEAGLAGAGTTEEGEPAVPVISLMEGWQAGGRRIQRHERAGLGGSMRLGAFPATLQPQSRIAALYGELQIEERHRHRFEIDKTHAKHIEAKSGLVFSGWSPDGQVPEILERTDHPWFFAVQFHPELKSRPMRPHPLFASFVAAAAKQSRLL